jgi:hypothetical protein
MADASSLRKCSTLPVATGLGAGKVRYNTTINQAEASDGTDFVVFTRQAGPTFIQQGALASACFWVAPRACKVTSLAAVFSTAGSDPYAVTANITKDVDKATGVGTITVATNSTAVAGVGTNFQTTLAQGTALFNATGTLIGVVTSVGSDTAATLTGNAAVAVTGGGYLYSQAVGTGVTQQTGTFNLKSTANVTQQGVLTATTADNYLAQGDRLSVKLTGTSTSVAGVVITSRVAWL